MADIQPFKPFYYNPDKVSIEDVVTEPYDKIDASLYVEYTKRSSYTTAKLLLNPDWPVDKDLKGKYQESEKCFLKWIQDRVLLQLDRPCFLVYQQDFIYEDVNYSRLGFIALCRVEDFDKKVVLPHEFTLAKPKADRMEHLKTMKSHLGQIFCLYEDSEHQIDAHLKSVLNEVPLYQFEDKSFFVNHKVWVLDSTSELQAIQKLMHDKQLLIADGHHRYETALSYSKEGGSEYVMMTLVNLYDPGLLILPTHRAVYNISDVEMMDLVQKLRDDFIIERIGVETQEDRIHCIHKLNESGNHVPSFGLYYGSNEFILLKYKNEAIANEAFGELMSKTWRSLDVVILHKCILEKYLGITKEKLAEQSNITYIRKSDAGFDLVDKGGAQLIFFMNPTNIKKVFEVCKSGERMPQKSTDFYPKLLSGIMINSFR